MGRNRVHHDVTHFYASLPLLANRGNVQWHCMLLVITAGPIASTTISVFLPLVHYKKL